jgi:hypothetical protein
MIMNGEYIWTLKDEMQSIFRFYPRTQLERLRKTAKSSARIVGNLAKIGTISKIQI